MKNYITIAVERNQIGKLEKDVSAFMEDGFEPHGGLVAVSDGIDGSTRHAAARHEADLGREAGGGHGHLEDEPEPEPQLREDRGERE
jgi:hypothetical protein